MVIAGFEGDISGRPARVAAALYRIDKRRRLGMELARALVPAFADHLAIAHQHAADHRVGRGPALGPAGQLDSSQYDGGFVQRPVIPFLQRQSGRHAEGKRA